MAASKRKLGNSGLEIAPLAFGGNVFGWTIDEATSFRLLDAFVDGGFNLVDTADVYSRWIASATSLDQLNELMGAVRLNLDAGAIERLNQASACSDSKA